MLLLENLHQDPDFAHYVFNLPYTLNLNYEKKAASTSEEANLESLTTDLGFDSTETCQKYLELQRFRINKIKEKYPIQELEEEELNSLLQQQITTLIDIQMAPTNDACNRKYRNAVITASAAAMAGSFACAGFPPCEVVVLVGYVAAIDTAALNLEECLRGAKGDTIIQQSDDDNQLSSSDKTVG